jgi:hypothetical protein
MAHKDEGPLIGRWVADWGGPSWDWINWSQVYPYWLVGEVDGIPHGTVMASPGQPFGRVEFLCIDPTLPKRHKAILARDLAYAAIASCQLMGSQAVLSTINAPETQWSVIGERRGWINMGTGTLVLKRITHE